LRPVVFLCFDFICNFFLLSPFRDQKRLERKTFFFFCKISCVFCAALSLQMGKGARAWLERCRIPHKKGATGASLAREWGVSEERGEAAGSFEKPSRRRCP